MTTCYFSDLDDGLDSNFCRNPGDGTSPWCYVHRDNCGRNYCDPCGLGKAGLVSVWRIYTGVQTNVHTVK